MKANKTKNGVTVRLTKEEAATFVEALNRGVGDVMDRACKRTCCKSAREAAATLEGMIELLKGVTS